MKLRIFLVVASSVVSLITGFCYFAERFFHRKRRARAKPFIGLSMDTLKEERWHGDRDLFVTRARELGADVLVQSANSDDTRQISDVRALINRASIYSSLFRITAVRWRKRSTWHMKK